MILSASSVAALSDYGSSWYFFDRQLDVGGRRRRPRSSSRRASTTTRWRTLRAVRCSSSRVVLLVVVLVPGVGIYGRRLAPLARRRVRSACSRASSRSSRCCCCGADVLAAARRRARTTGARGARCSSCSAVSAALVMLEPDLDSTIVLALDRRSRCSSSAACRAEHLATLVGARRRARRPCSRSRRRTGGRACSRSCTRGRTTANTGYQIAQSLIALGSGGVDRRRPRRGPGQVDLPPERAHRLHLRDHRRGARPRRLPARARRCSSASGSSASTSRGARPTASACCSPPGVTAWIVGQAVINLGAVVGLLPVSGIPLPFLSAGGSSLVITMLGAGILANIAAPDAAAQPRRGRERRARARAHRAS